MTKEVKARRGIWAKALRSGEYKQVREVLNNSQGHCCLGVGCEVVELLGVKVKRTAEGFVKGTTLLEVALLDATTCFTSSQPSVARALGVTPEEQAELTSANDTGVSFSFIASMIDNNTEQA